MADPGVAPGFEERGCHPIIPLRETPAVKAGKQRPPICEHGEWTFAVADAKRQASKWRCPTGECQPASCWIKADRLHTLIPRTSLRWKKLYRLRGAWNGRTVGSRTSGRCCRYGLGVASGSSFTLT